MRPQLTNGAWSGAGYAYWAESLPTRVRGTAIGWLGAMCALGLILGTLLWTRQELEAVAT